MWTRGSALQRRCRAVARIPYDAHLEEGAEVDLELMSPATVNGYLALAAIVFAALAVSQEMPRWTLCGSLRPLTTLARSRSCRLTTKRAARR